MRFFDKNENEMMHLVDLKKPEANFKIKEDFMCGWPEDIRDLCKKIWNVIEAHNFDIPGLAPHFVLDGDCENVEMMSIRYNDWFRIWGSGEIVTKTIKLHCWGDTHSATLEHFIGELDTPQHKLFLAGDLTNRKLRGKEKIHLRYNSQCPGRPFCHDNDFGRLYDPVHPEPHTHSYDDILNQVKTTCEEILQEFEALPRPTQRNIFTKPTDIPLLNPLFEGQVLYGYAKTRGKKEVVKSLECGWRMVTLGGQRPKEHKYRNLMTEGFVSLERDYYDRPKDTDYYQSGMYTSSSYEYINAYEIHLKNANHVYVVDSSLQDKARAKSMELHEEKHPNWKESEDYNIRSPRFTDAEVDQIRCDQAASMVHINDYRGEYDKPIVMVCRKVNEDEIGRLLSSKNYDDFHKKIK
jgi:hypothetical protein